MQQPKWLMKTRMQWQKTNVTNLHEKKLQWVIGFWLESWLANLFDTYKRKWWRLCHCEHEAAVWSNCKFATVLLLLEFRTMITKWLDRISYKSIPYSHGSRERNNVSWDIMSRYCNLKRIRMLWKDELLHPSSFYVMQAILCFLLCHTC